MGILTTEVLICRQILSVETDKLTCLDIMEISMTVHDFDLVLGLMSCLSTFVLIGLLGHMIK